MPVSPSETRELFARECNFPTEHETVVDQVGDVAIDPPNGDAVTVEAVLERSDDASYGSVAELHNTVMAYLDDDHIGRKHYDDRSPSPERGSELSL